MRSRIMRLVVVALATAGSPAIAQTHGVTYDCDTAANHYSDLALPVPGKAFTVSGKVALNTIADSKQYVPLARLSISDGQSKPGQPTEWAGFEYGVIPKMKGNPTPLPILNFSTRAAERDNQIELAGKPSAREIAFSLSYDGSVVTAIVDGHEKQMPFVAADPVVRIVCSTGEFLYTDVAITAR